MAVSLLYLALPRNPDVEFRGTLDKRHPLLAKCVSVNSSSIATSGQSGCKKQAGVVMCCYGMFLESSAIAANGESSKEKHVCGDVLLRHVS